MEKTLIFVRNTSLMSVALLAVFAAVGAVAVILDALTWDILADWLLKAALIAVVVIVLSGILGVVGGAFDSKTEE